MSKVAERKAKLHDDLVARAQSVIAERGLENLRARDLATDVGCSLGQIYNVFEDLDALILNVSLKTLIDIDGVMTESARRTAGEPPAAAMIDLSHSYFQFVVENTNLWRTLFEHALPANREVPDWIIEKQVTLLDHISKPLAQLSPSLSEAELRQTAQLLFSAVHGVVNLSVDQRTTGLPADQVKPQLELLVGMFVRGLLAADHA